MIYLFWVVLILFSFVQSKIIHYSSLCYFPFTFLGAHFLYHLVKNRTHIRKWNVIALISISILYGMAIIAASYIDIYKTAIIESGLIKDAFAIGNLEADGQWKGFESLMVVF